MSDGRWIHTFTGQQFNPLSPDPRMVRLEDVAHALALKCRWTGHCRTFYSIAEHSVRVATLLGEQGLGPAVPLLGLLHDVGEAYLPDVASPIKRSFYAQMTPATGATSFSFVESMLRCAIFEGLGVFELGDPDTNDDVRWADQVLLSTEARDLMHGTADWGWEPPMPLDEPIEPWPWDQAEREFVATFQFLVREWKDQVRRAEG